MSSSRSPAPSGTQTVVRLVRKDLYLHRRLGVASLVAGFAALGLLAMGGETSLYMGGVLLVTVLIALGAGLAFLTLIEERQEQTLPFIHSLPVSTRQTAAAKILANLLTFGAVWSVLLVGTLVLILRDDELPDGLVVYAIIVLAEIVLGTCSILLVAMATESVAWTIGATIFGNLLFNGFLFQVLHTPTFLAAAESARVVWPSEALFLLFAELAGIVLLTSLAFAISTRRKDIL